MKINEIQPLAWEVTVLPEELRFIHVLRLPDHWRVAIRSLSEVDRVPPIKCLHLVLQALAPEIICFFPSAFTENPQYRPEYWLAAENLTEVLNPERLLWAIISWLNACYSSKEVQAIAQHLQPSDLTWEHIDLHTASQTTIEQVLPGLVARWLLGQRFEFHLSNDAGQIMQWPVRLAPSSGPESDLITWAPTSYHGQKFDHYYSYYLKFRLASLPDSRALHLLCQPGIRRWVSAPLARISNTTGKLYVDLAWGREKSVYFARQSASWLTQRPAEMSLLRLRLQNYNQVSWIGRLPAVLASLTPHEVIPDPLHLLAHPTDFSPGVLIVYDNLMGERHRVGLGIEAADRWEVFNQLSKALPTELQPASLWRKGGDFERAYPSFSAKYHTQVGSEPRLEAVKHLDDALLIEIYSSDADHWEQVVRKTLGMSDECPATSSENIDGDRHIPLISIRKEPLTPELLAVLPSDAGENYESQSGAERQRAQFIEKHLPPVSSPAGVLVEMPNYQEVYARDSREARRDPKRAVRWGLAKTGRVSQFIRPESASPDDYELRIENGVRDLLRQMDFHLNPLYTGFEKTSLPETLDLLGFYQIRLNGRHRGEQPVTLPLVIHAPAHRYGMSVCLPGDNGPTWHQYRKGLLATPEFSGGYRAKTSVRDFFQGVIGNMTLPHPTLLLVSEQNLRELWPELKDEELFQTKLQLSGILPSGCPTLRVARLRFSSHGSVPLVCPTHSFGRFSGLYHDERSLQIWYSIQHRPLAAQRPTGLRQRDAQRKHSWNPSTVEILMLNLQPGDKAEEWAWVVHRLREESSHTDTATLFPEPLYAAEKMSEYVLRIADQDE